MKNKYVEFISDDHFIKCVENLHNAYLKAKKNISKKNFYNNKIDTIKLTFDSKFNNIDEDNLIQAEILRQIDKSINNSIGTFHEEILGGIKDYEVGKLSGFDIKAKDNSLFALLIHEKTPVNLNDAIFDKLAKTANIFKNSKCYLVDFTVENEKIEKWTLTNDESTVSHKNVYKISSGCFYTLLTGNQNSLKQLSQKTTAMLKEF